MVIMSLIILLVYMNVVRHSDSVVHNSRSSSRRRTPVRQTILGYMFGHRIRDSKKLAEGGKQKACKGTEHHKELLSKVGVVNGNWKNI